MFWQIFRREPRPYNAGWLPEKDGHQIAYYEYGNPNGRPVISFHGGPGAGAKPRHTSFFDLEKYRVILFDQRGCGLSRFRDRLYKNTTGDTLSDALRLLNHLGIKGKVVAAGGSFGSTCALLFAEAHPGMVSKIAVNSICLARKRDIQDWWMKDARRFYPDMIEEVERRAPGRGPIWERYSRLFHSKGRAGKEAAMKYYLALERMLGSADPKFEPPAKENYEKALAGVEISMHYDIHNCFIAENQILRDIRKIRHIPAVIVHNRLDMICPVEQAWELSKVLPKSRLVIVPDRGHGSDMMAKAFRQAIKKRFG